MTTLSFFDLPSSTKFNFDLRKESSKINNPSKLKFEIIEDVLVVNCTVDDRDLEINYKKIKDHDHVYEVLADSDRGDFEWPRYVFVGVDVRKSAKSIYSLPTVGIENINRIDDLRDSSKLVIFSQSQIIPCPLVEGSCSISNQFKIESLEPYKYWSDMFGLAFINKASVHAPDFVFAESNFYFEPLTMARWRMPRHHVFYDVSNNHTYFRWSGRMIESGGVGIVFHRCNFGHWFMQNFPLLLAIKEMLEMGLLDRRELKFITTGYDAFQKSVFEYFGLGDVVVIDLYNPKIDIVRVDVAVIPTSCVVDPRYAWNAYIGKALDAIRPPRDPDAPALIFVSRKDVGNARGLANEDELIEALRRAGFPFVPIRAAELSMDEQRRVFSNAQVVIGPHGGGLNNLMWAPKGATGVELIHDGLAANRPWFYHQICMAGYRYGMVNAPRDFAHENPGIDTMHVPPEPLIEIVRNALAV